MLIDNPEELLDLVNENDVVIDTILREEVPNLATNKRGFVRAVGIFLQDSNNQLFIPTRSLQKKLLGIQLYLFEIIILIQKYYLLLIAALLFQIF